MSSFLLSHGWILTGSAFYKEEKWVHQKFPGFYFTMEQALEKERMPEWIKFMTAPDAGDGRKTKIWDVVTIDGSSKLGEIRWFSRWRRYAFFPDRKTVFEQDCLRRIADFIQLKTEEHKRLKKDERREQREHQLSR